VHQAHAWFVMLKLFDVAYASAVVRVLLSQLNCICDTPFVSLADNDNITLAPVVYIAHVLIVIEPVGPWVSRMMLSEYEEPRLPALS